jgi:predicted P-loop ATPase
MNEENIQQMQIKDMLSTETICSIQAEPEEVREQLKALCFARLDELKATKDLKDQFKKVFKAYEKADKELADAYTRQNAKNNSSIPLSYDGQGKPMSTIDNFVMILRNDPYFSTLKFNQLSYSPEHTVDGKIEKWQDKDDSRARFYIEQKYKIHSRDKLDDALRIIFAEREYHPIKQIIEAVEWDGVSRIQELFIKWLKCEDTPYIREVTRLVFAGGIHRLYNQGCKFDDVAVLIGTKQGEGKSTFVRWLAIKDEFFTEVTEIEGQKGIEAIEGAWLCEIAELLAVTKTKEVEAVKSYITKLVDRYRRPFDRRTTDHKRQCVFIGTTNKEQFLTDKTGNRRWYPVKVNSSGYDLHDHKEEIQADILQAWAEAKCLFDKGELQPYADRNLLKEIRKQQEKAVEDDYRVGLIESFLENREKVCIMEIWKIALDNPYTKPTRKESNEITLILQSIGGWERGKVEKHQDYGNQMFWHKNIEFDFQQKVKKLDDFEDEIPF